jgi:hypothetical protein
MLHDDILDPYEAIYDVIRSYLKAEQVAEILAPSCGAPRLYN